VSTDENAPRDETRRDGTADDASTSDDAATVDDTRRSKRYLSGGAIDAMLERMADRGDFDELPGKGRPIPNLDPNDHGWWIRSKLEREGVSVAPEPLRLRREIERSIDALWSLGSEERVRARIAEINLRIRALNQSTSIGPALGMAPYDVDEVLARWRKRREERDEDA